MMMGIVVMEIAGKLKCRLVDNPLSAIIFWQHFLD
jgi:hypothetical protein